MSRSGREKKKKKRRKKSKENGKRTRPQLYKGPITPSRGAFLTITSSVGPEFEVRQSFGATSPCQHTHTHIPYPMTFLPPRLPLCCLCGNRDRNRPPHLNKSNISSAGLAREDTNGEDNSHQHPCDSCLLAISKGVVGSGGTGGGAGVGEGIPAQSESSQSNDDTNMEESTDEAEGSVCTMSETVGLQSESATQSNDEDEPSDVTTFRELLATLPNCRRDVLFYYLLGPRAWCPARMQQTLSEELEVSLLLQRPDMKIYTNYQYSTGPRSVNFLPLTPTNPAG